MYNSSEIPNVVFNIMNKLKTHVEFYCRMIRLMLGEKENCIISRKNLLQNERHNNSRIREIR